MYYEEDDIMVAEPCFTKPTGIAPEGCVSVAEAFSQLRQHVKQLYDGSLY